MTTEINTQMTDDLKNVGREARNLLNTAVGRAHETVDQVRTGVRNALQTSKAAARCAQAKTVSTAKATDRCVHNHPYQTIGVFFGLGLLAGILFARK